MKRGTYVLIIFLIFFVLILATAFAFIYFEFTRPPKVKSMSYLEINLAGPIQDRDTGDIISTLLLGSSPLSTHDIWMNLRKARVDDRIKSLVLRLGYMECDWAKVNEIRDLVLDFRNSGKKAYACIDEALEFDKEYYLATACDEIILHPMGTLVINGIGGYVPFVKNALDKLGIEAEFEHVEEYKTAASLFTESGFTTPHREMMESIYGDLDALYIRTISEARGKTETEMRALIEKSFFQGQEALEAGLVDRLLYDDQLRARLAFEGRELTRITHGLYTKISPSSLGLNKGKKLALIYGMGPIHTGESLPQTMGSATLARWIKRARMDGSIKALVLRVDSPGGSVVGSDIIWREIVLTKAEKPVIISMSDVAGSGGYWMSTAADKILAQPQTLTGSIGVVSGKFNMSGLYEKLGISAERLVFGEKADMFSSFRAWTPEERRMLKSEIVWVYERFLDKVSEGRGMTPEAVNAIGRGRVWTGHQALEFGLVDELGGLPRAVEMAKVAAGMARDEEVRLVVWPKKVSLFNQLMGHTAVSTRLGLNPALDKALMTLQLLEKDRLWALMPFWIRGE